jgi:hypothetical protein
MLNLIQVGDYGTDDEDDDDDDSACPESFTPACKTDSSIIKRTEEVSFVDKTAVLNRVSLDMLRAEDVTDEGVLAGGRASARQLSSEELA